MIEPCEETVLYHSRCSVSAPQAGKTVFVAAHGNSIRAIVKMIEGISDDVIPGLEIPTGALVATSLGLTGAASCWNSHYLGLRDAELLGNPQKFCSVMICYFLHPYSTRLSYFGMG